MRYLDGAKSVLCLLSVYPSNEEMQLKTKECLEILSHAWDARCKMHDIYLHKRIYSADTVARTILSAPNDTIPELVSYYSRYVTDESYQLIMAFVYLAAINDLYEHFWIVWQSFYHAVVIERSHGEHNQTLSAFMLNPVESKDWGDEWFALREQDLEFYRRISSDKGEEPIVLWNIVSVANTIAKKYYMKMLAIIDDIIVRHPCLQLGDLRKVTIAGMDAILRKIEQENLDEVRTDVRSHARLVRILEFMTQNESAYASQVRNKI